MESDQILDKLIFWLRSSIPFVTVLILLLFGLAPTKIPGFSYVVPIYSIIGVYYWSMYKPELFSYGSGFSLGLFEDLLIGLPLGSSSLVILFIQWVIFNQQKLFADDSFVSDWIVFCFISSVALIVKWILIFILSEISFTSFVDLVFVYLLTIFIYPLIALVFTKVRNWMFV